MPLIRALFARLRYALPDTGGMQIVEFAVSLPLLVVFAVGIIDFGSAFNVKQRVAFMAQEAARIGASQPTSDMNYSSGTCTELVAVCAVRDVVAHTLASNKMNDCGLAGASPTTLGSLTWKFETTSGCPTALRLTVNRGYTYTTSLADPFDTQTYTIEATQVTFEYPYQWQFNKVIKLIVPGANYAGVSQIKSVATMQNLN
jgi:Flp pilus assembly protein TadG